MYSYEHLCNIFKIDVINAGEGSQTDEDASSAGRDKGDDGGNEPDPGENRASSTTTRQPLCLMCQHFGDTTFYLTTVPRIPELSTAKGFFVRCVKCTDAPRLRLEIKSKVTIHVLIVL